MRVKEGWISHGISSFHFLMMSVNLFPRISANSLYKLLFGNSPGKRFRDLELLGVFSQTALLACEKHNCMHVTTA